MNPSPDTDPQRMDDSNPNSRGSGMNPLNPDPSTSIITPSEMPSGQGGMNDSSTPQLRRERQSKPYRN